MSPTPPRRVARALTLCGLLLGTGCTASVDEVPMPYFDVPVTCDNFCSTMLRHCRRVEQMYASLDDCQQTCSTWPNDPNATRRPMGNSLQCRMVYATMAAHVREKLEFCSNAGPSGGVMCHDG